MEMLTTHVRSIKGIAAELSNFVQKEDERIESSMGPFMEKLAGLSAEYEMEKAQLEKELLSSLEQGRGKVITDVVEQRASARHYSNLVNEYFERTEGLLKEGLQARRDAESSFTSRMMEVIRGEYDEIISGMRQEDRQKAHFERVENHKKLESCRIAVRLDLAAMLLQQRAVMERQKREEIARMEQTMNMLKADNENKLDEMRRVVKQARESVDTSKIELKVSALKMQKDMDLLEAENQGMTARVAELQENVKFWEEEARRLQEEADTAIQEKQALEDSMKEQVAYLEEKIVKQEEYYKERVAMMDTRLKQCQDDIQVLHNEKSALTKERDELQKFKDEHAAKMKMLEKKHAAETERMQHSIDTLTRQRNELQKQAQDQLEKLLESRAEMERMVSEHQRVVADRDAKFAKMKSELEDAHRKTLREKTDLRSNVGVWLHDQINLRRKLPIEMTFEGSDVMLQEATPFFKSAEQPDLRSLHKIIMDKAGHYFNSPDRVLVSRMDDFLLAAAHVTSPDDLGLDRSEAGSEREVGGVSKEQVQKEIDAAVDTLKKQYEEKIKALTAEWRAKAVSLAQRLERTERELNYPRPQDLEKIAELETQINALILALESATAAANAAASERGRSSLSPSRQGSSKLLRQGSSISVSRNNPLVRQSSSASMRQQPVRNMGGSIK